MTHFVVEVVGWVSLLSVSILAMALCGAGGTRLWFHLLERRRKRSGLRQDALYRTFDPSDEQRVLLLSVATRVPLPLWRMVRPFTTRRARLRMAGRRLRARALLRLAGD